MLDGVKITHAEGALLYTKPTLAGLSGLDTLTETIVAAQGASSPGAETYVPVAGGGEPDMLVKAAARGSDLLAVSKADAASAGWIAGSAFQDRDGAAWSGFEPRSSFGPSSGFASGALALGGFGDSVRPGMDVGPFQARTIPSLARYDFAFG